MRPPFQGPHASPPTCYGCPWGPHALRCHPTPNPTLWLPPRLWVSPAAVAGGGWCPSQVVWKGRQHCRGGCREPCQGSRREKGRLKCSPVPLGPEVRPQAAAAWSEAHSTLIHKVGNTTPSSAVSSAFYFMGDCTVCLSFGAWSLQAARSSFSSCLGSPPAHPVASEDPLHLAHGPQWARPRALWAVTQHGARLACSPSPPHFLFVSLFPSPQAPPQPHIQGPSGRGHSGSEGLTPASRPDVPFSTTTPTLQKATEAATAKFLPRPGSTARPPLSRGSKPASHCPAAPRHKSNGLMAKATAMLGEGRHMAPLSVSSPSFWPLPPLP